MNALPSLNGSVGYIFTSCNLDVKGSGDVRFKDMIDRFKVYDQPRRPEGKPEEWLAGERVDTRGAFVSAADPVSSSLTARARLPPLRPHIHPDGPPRRALLDAAHAHAAGHGRRDLGPAHAALVREVPRARAREQHHVQPPARHGQGLHRVHLERRGRHVGRALAVQLWPRRAPRCGRRGPRGGGPCGAEESQACGRGGCDGGRAKGARVNRRGILLQRKGKECRRCASPEGVRLLPC